MRDGQDRGLCALGVRTAQKHQADRFSTHHLCGGKGGALTQVKGRLFVRLTKALYRLVNSPGLGVGIATVVPPN